MTSEPAEPAPSSTDAAMAGATPSARPFTTTSTIAVAIAVCFTTMSFNVWWPFMPLYALELGAKSDADALFWVAVATTVQGVARLASGPFWGVVSDRYGRKMMFLRALFLSSTVGAVAAFLNAPWQLALPLGFAGLFSGFNPAAVALVSVSVPNSKLNSSLSWITGSQYIGTTFGPAFGAVLAIVLDYRSTILVASILPLIMGTVVALIVPRDQTSQSLAQASGRKPQKLEPFKVTVQFLLAILVYSTIFALNQLVRLATPISLRAIEGSEDVAGIVGLTFSLGGLVSAISVLFIGPRFFKAGRMQISLVIACGIAAVGFLIIALSMAVPMYILGFVLVAMVLSAMTPTSSTLIAANASRARRGTAFGIASSAQAVSFAVGPIAAALFAAVSLEGGFITLAVLLLLLGLLLKMALREPDLTDT